MKDCLCQWQFLSQRAHEAYTQGQVGEAARLYRESFELALALPGDNVANVIKSLMDCLEFGEKADRLNCLAESWDFFTTLKSELIPDGQVGKIIETVQWIKLQMFSELEQAQAHISLEKTWQSFLLSLIGRLQ